MIVSNQLQEVFKQNSQKQFIAIVEKYLQSINDSFEFKHGEKTLLDNGVSVVSINAASGAANKNLLEAHRVYNDLHCVMQGVDTISYKNIKECKAVNKEYTIDGDYILYDEAPVDLVTVEKGDFCFIPNEFAHMALYNDTGMVKKLVFKIPVQPLVV